MSSINKGFELCCRYLTGADRSRWGWRTSVMLFIVCQLDKARHRESLYCTKIRPVLPLWFCVLRVQSQVDEVIDVMQENISKVIERGERLDDLQDKSGETHEPPHVHIYQTCVHYSSMKGRKYHYYYCFKISFPERPYRLILFWVT